MWCKERVFPLTNHRDTPTNGIPTEGIQTDWVFKGRDEMKIERGPILGALAIAVALSLAACVSPVEPEGGSQPDPDAPEEPVDFRAGQASSGTMLPRLAFG